VPKNIVDAAVWSLKSSPVRTRKGGAMSQKTSSRRAHGTGTLYSQERASGQEFWYGRWYLGGRRVNRRLGPKRRRGTGEGLNRTQAEVKLRELMVRERPPAPGSLVSFASAAELMLRDLEALGRKPTTLDNYRSILRSHLLPRFGEVAVSQVRRVKSKRSWLR